MQDLIDRLKGNGKPWTFKEIISTLESADKKIKSQQNIIEELE
jgi:hypothetical protein